MWATRPIHAANYGRHSSASVLTLRGSGEYANFVAAYLQAVNERVILLISQWVNQFGNPQYCDFRGDPPGLSKVAFRIREPVIDSHFGAAQSVLN
jgi:hypothetical protein